MISKTKSKNKESKNLFSFLPSNLLSDIDENLESNVSNIFIIKFLKYSLQKMIIVVIIKIKLILIL